MSSTRFTQTYSELPKHFYCLMATEPLQSAQLIHSNQKLMDELGILINDERLLQMTSGHQFPDKLQPLAQKYTGHQFGYYNPDLGDGRGVLLGQVEDNQSQLWDLHLKGSGQTPYSRRGDGRAVLRSAVREYLIGEALHYLGVPTTRCLSLCSSPEPVQREQLEPRASYIRVAKTHIRFGHFEWLKQKGTIDEQKQLADYVINQVYPDLKDIHESNRYSALLKRIIENTAIMIAGWQKVGFCHGVMNTDNMSVAGETFDFGPYAFLDDCKVHYICNHSDTEGRYAFSQQPNIGLWNCQVLCFAFSDMVSQTEIDDALELFISTFNEQYLQNMAEKFGLQNPDAEDRQLIADTLLLMDKSNLDFHYFFSQLTFFNSEQEERFRELLPLADSSLSEQWQHWLDRFRNRINNQSPQSFAQLTANNPHLILRNYIAQEIIEAAEKQNFAPLNKWMTALQTPVLDESIQPPWESYIKPPKYHQKGMALSCSS